MSSDQTAFDLVAADLKAATEAHRAELNRQLFACDSLVMPPASHPWWWRWRSPYWRVRGYCATLWDALRGRDPYEESDDY